VVSVPVLGSYSTFGLAVPARSGALLVLCALAALLVLSAIVGLRRGRRFAASLSLLSLLAIAVQCFAVTNVREELHAHVVLWFSGIGVPALMGIGAALAPELRAVPARLAEVALVLAVAAVTAVGAVEVADNPRLEWAANGGGDYAYEGRIEPLWRQVDAYTGSHSISNPAVAMATRDRWLYAAGVIARLRERGDRVRVDPAWAFMFGDRLKADGREDATLFFAAPGPPPPLPPGARVAASTPDATVYAVIRAPAAPSRE
jgi:hypothetical protein